MRMPRDVFKYPIITDPYITWKTSLDFEIALVDIIKNSLGCRIGVAILECINKKDNTNMHINHSRLLNRTQAMYRKETLELYNINA